MKTFALMTLAAQGASAISCLKGTYCNLVSGEDILCIGADSDLYIAPAEEECGAPLFGADYDVCQTSVKYTKTADVEKYEFTYGCAYADDCSAASDLTIMSAVTLDESTATTCTVGAECFSGDGGFFSAIGDLFAGCVDAPFTETDCTGLVVPTDGCMTDIMVDGATNYTIISCAAMTSATSESATVVSCGDDAAHHDDTTTTTTTTTTTIPTEAPATAAAAATEEVDVSPASTVSGFFLASVVMAWVGFA